MQSPPRHASLAPVAIIIMGVSGSGKSTLGAILAQALNCPFLDGDDFHDAAAIAKMSAGEPLTDDDRWPWLDRLGRAMGQTLVSGGTAVAACSALRRSYRDRLRAAISAPTRFVLLDASPDELQRRLDHRAGHYMPASLLGSQLATLERPGADEAAALFTADASPRQLRDATLTWLEASDGRTGGMERPSGH
ncbi:carbohydrate kinase, thermoresistant glucokinase family [Caulobacter sp. AP07]|uniref:gluconokinase n=1 Tax=Caulobacter sp. AP07 TaxID=1144304 RepID=UPI000271DF61|nr:gluconokinase [Caulobacter sp. AP07]EJL23858.1 carbohydrate kinase, thermoresistant glucokinase family [Caulobacter sp. AP07]